MESNAGKIVSQYIVDASKGLKSLESIDKTAASTTKSLDKVSTSAKNTEEGFRVIEKNTVRMGSLFKAINNIGLGLVGVGVAAVALSTQFEGAAGATEALKVSAYGMEQALGKALYPILEQVATAALSVALAFSQWAETNGDTIRSVVQLSVSVGAGIVAFMALIDAVEIAGKVMSLMAGASGAAWASFGLLAVAAVAISVVLAQVFQEALQEEMALSGNTNKAADLFKKLGDAGKKAGTDTAAAMEAATKRVNDLKQSIADENTAFNKQLADIVDKRQSQLDNNKKTLDREKRDWTEKQAAMAKDYKQKTEDLKRQNEARLNDLEKSLSDTLIVGSSTYNEDLENYKSKVSEEIAAQEQQVAEAAAQYASDTEAAKAAYDEKANALQAQIAEDEAFLQKHADIIKNINRAEIKDEIDQAVYLHQRKIDELNKQLDEAKNSMKSAGVSMAADWNMAASTFGTLDWERIFGNVGNKLGNLFKGVLGDIGFGLIEISRLIALEIRKAVGNIPFIGKDLVKSMATESQINGNADSMMKLLNMWSGSIKGKFAGGVKNFSGGLAMVGENGPEIVELPTGSNVYTNQQTRNMTSNDNRNINVNNTNIINNADDFSIWNAKLAYQLKNI